jgi:general secretion pathway protein B
VSFILDALKKSEGERQRQSGPALFEVKVAPPRTRFPPWALAIALLLAVNLGVVAWFLLRDRPPVSLRSADAGSPAATTPQPPAASQPAPVESIERSAGSPLSSARPSEPEPVLTDEEPLEEPFADELEEPLFEEPPAAPAATGRVTRGTDLGVPTYDQLASAPGQSLPELSIELHVYADAAQDRFVFIHNRRLKEGDALPDGTRVERIVPEGAILSVRGRRFLLQRE